MCFRVPLLVAWILWLLRSCIAIVSNRTIDDTKGDSITGFIPIYSPAKQWTPGTNCSGCLVQPEIGRLFDYTWHDTTQGDGGVPSTVTLNFTAIYLFCVVPNSIPFATTLVDLKFVLDGVLIGTYTHVPDSSNEILYSVPVLSSVNLKNEPHTLVAQTASNSLFVFDFAMYTFDDSPTTANTTAIDVSASATGTQSSSLLSPTQTDISHHSVPLTAIIAGSISGVAVIASLLVGVLCLKRRRKRTAHVDESGPDTDVLMARVPTPPLPLSASLRTVSASISVTHAVTSSGDSILPPYAPSDPYPHLPANTDPSQSADSDSSQSVESSRETASPGLQGKRALAARW